jgi:YbbR domain-containing protein
MWRWIVENYRTFLWAFALALAVWVVAVTSADPDESHQLSNQVLVEIFGQDPSLVMSTDIPNVVDLELRAPRSVWDQIESDPQSVRAVLDLSGMSIGEHTLPLQIQISARPVQIVSAVPSSVTFVLEPLATRTLEVELDMIGEPAIGYQVGDALLEPNNIVIAGAKSKVDKVARARLSLNLDGIRETVDESLPVEILDEEARTITDLSVSYSTVQVTLFVSQQGGYRDMAVKVNVAGQVATGYRLTNISVIPPVVTVFAGDAELVSSIPGVVETQPLDLQNADADITTRLPLNLPAGVSVVGEQTVLIQASVSPIESSLTLADENVQILNLPTGLTAQVSPGVVDVIVSGPLPLLDTLTRQDVRVTVNLDGLGEGVHQLTPRVEVLISDVDVESVLPSTIEVILVKAVTPSPTATP